MKQPPQIQMRNSALSSSGRSFIHGSQEKPLQKQAAALVNIQKPDAASVRSNVSQTASLVVMEEEKSKGSIRSKYSNQIDISKFASPDYN